MHAVRTDRRTKKQRGPGRNLGAGGAQKKYPRHSHWPRIPQKWWLFSSAPSGSKTLTRGSSKNFLTKFRPRVFMDPASTLKTEKGSTFPACGTSDRKRSIRRLRKTETTQGESVKRTKSCNIKLVKREGGGTPFTRIKSLSPKNGANRKTQQIKPSGKPVSCARHDWQGRPGTGFFCEGCNLSLHKAQYCYGCYQKTGHTPYRVCHGKHTH